MSREDAMIIIEECCGNAFKNKEVPFKTIEILEAVQIMNNTIDQLKKARKAARRYKRMYLELKAEVGDVQCKD